MRFVRHGAWLCDSGLFHHATIITPRHFTRRRRALGNAARAEALNRRRATRVARHGFTADRPTTGDETTQAVSQPMTREGGVDGQQEAKGEYERPVGELLHRSESMGAGVLVAVRGLRQVGPALATLARSLLVAQGPRNKPISGKGLPILSLLDQGQPVRLDR